MDSTEPNILQKCVADQHRLTEALVLLIPTLLTMSTICHPQYPLRFLYRDFLMQ